MSSHSPFTFSRPRSRNCPNPRPCLICPNTGSTGSLRSRVALTSSLVPQLAPHPVPGGEISGYASLGSRRRYMAVPGPVRRYERVDAPGVQSLHFPRRVVARIGGNLPGNCPDVADGLLQHGHGLPLVRRLVGGPGRHDHLVGAVHHRPAVAGLLEQIPQRRQVVLAEVGDGPEVRSVVGRQRPEGDVLVMALRERRDDATPVE